MPVILHGDQLPLSAAEVNNLWTSTISLQHYPDQEVGVRCVDEVEIQKLNMTYRHKDTPTNVLTFSYPPEHDIALCLAVAEREAVEREMSLRDYCALLLVHAFLHATGLDHEVSSVEEAKMQAAEQNILSQAGFARTSL